MCQVAAERALGDLERELLVSSAMRSQTGVSMIEVLITIVISAFGLLAVAALQAKMHMSEMEAAQRAHAIVLTRYITDRMNANRKNALSYVTGPVGADVGVQDCSGMTGHQLDLCDWGNLLAGAAETQGGEKVGAMIGARGCIVNTDAVMPRKFTVTVVWQGLTTTETPAGVDCANDKFTDRRQQRAIVVPIVLACLENDINTGLCVTL